MKLFQMASDFVSAGFDFVAKGCTKVAQKIESTALGLLGGTAVVGGVSLTPSSSYAVAPTTIAELTGGISFADVSLGVLAVAGLLTAVYVGWRAAKFVIHAVKGM